MGEARTEVIGDIAVITWITDRLTGDPDGVRLREEVGSVLDRGIDRIVVDISHIRWSDSSGLGILISSWVLARERKAELVVVLGSERINSLFGVTNLDAIMGTYHSLEAAMGHFQK